nr:MAG TPA: hypothetical protein [Caudoviricetes sp.]
MFQAPTGNLKSTLQKKLVGSNYLFYANPLRLPNAL